MQRRHVQAIHPDVIKVTRPSRTRYKYIHANTHNQPTRRQKERQTDRQTDNQTDRQTDRQDRQTDRQPGNQTE